MGAIAATFFFIPFYRRTGELSAYQHLEHRFGAWARTYGVVCFVMLQVVRLGMITQLLGTVLAPLFDWDTRAMVIFLGVLITIYPMLGGTEGVIWAGVVQSVVLILGVIA
ncbi:MAG: sodium:solute symporter family transporter, partial [bacterium]